MKDDGKLLDGSGNVIGASLPVTDPKSQSRALSLVGSVDWIQVGREGGWGGGTAVSPRYQETRNQAQLDFFRMREARAELVYFMNTLLRCSPLSLVTI